MRPIKKVSKTWQDTESIQSYKVIWSVLGTRVPIAIELELPATDPYHRRLSAPRRKDEKTKKAGFHVGPIGESRPKCH